MLRHMFDEMPEWVGWKERGFWRGRSLVLRELVGLNIKFHGIVVAVELKFEWN